MKNDKSEMHVMHKMIIPKRMINPDAWKRISLFQLIYSVCGLILGLVCIIGGIILFLHGITGSTSWTAMMLGAKSEISDAAPGVVLFIVGLFVVFVTRFTAKVRR